ncbi:uncharacterized protein LOC135962225 [Calliphora vicina]|uniref:uncharacterized protein LOC135962225 n=1 Tax=Calliphora vicina TaxID=7373 RepID=UPI00325A4A3F
MTTLKGFRYVLFITVLGGLTGLTLYPIAIKPLFNVDDYKKLRKLQSWETFKRS